MESVLGQSMRATEALVVLVSAADPAVRTAARALAARAPERVRLVHADPAARTTGALRNAGLDAATGRYVLVLGSGERLQQHACRNLWQAGETSRADLIAGRWSRITDESGKEREPSWQAELFARSRTLSRFTEAPELVVRDALVTGFCLRREAARRHGLRYEEDLAHGEILFGPIAAASVGRIALVRRLIVTGRADPDRARDLVALVEAHRRVANTLIALGLPELREEREKAFHRDHLVPLVRSFPALPAVRRDRVATTAARTLTGPVPPELPPLERVAVTLLGRGDAEEVLAAAYALSLPATVCAPLTTGADGRVTWGGESEAPVADITELGHQYRRFGEMRLMNRLTRCAAADHGRLLLEGRLVLPGHTGPAPGAPLTATLEFRARGGARAVAFPAEVVRHDGTGITWRARADVARRLRPVGVRDTAWDARLIVEADGVRSVSDLFAPQDQVAGAVRFPARPRLGRLAGDTWEPYITLKDHFALRLTARRRPARTAHRLIRYATHFRPARKAKLIVRALRKRLDRYRSRGFKAPAYNTWLTRLPVRRGSVVFESHMGTCYGDSPRALYEEIRRQGLKLHATWSYDPSPAGFPDDARLVRRWSWRYLWALARAEYWVDNQGFPQQLRKPDRTTYLQTWHGSAYKRMGFDETRVRLQNAPQRERSSGPSTASTTPGCATRWARGPAQASSGSPNRRPCAAGRSCSRSWNADLPARAAVGVSPRRPPRPRPARAGPRASGGPRTAPAAAARPSPRGEPAAPPAGRHTRRRTDKNRARNAARNCAEREPRQWSVAKMSNSSSWLRATTPGGNAVMSKYVPRPPRTPRCRRGAAPPGGPG
ncbi:hypothetical protein SBADM41S_04061 [Streptomyces badius]